jgi:hypothetical protein
MSSTCRAGGKVSHRAPAIPAINNPRMTVTAFMVRRNRTIG